MANKAEVVRPEDQLVGILEQLYLQLDNFPNIKSFVSSHKLTSSSLFLAQSLQLVDGEITRNPSFLYECIGLLDVISVFSISVYGDSGSYLNALVDSIIRNRTAEDFKMTLAESVTTHIIVKNDDEMNDFLLSNKFLIALYIYTVICTITYRQ